MRLHPAGLVQLNWLPSTCPDRLQRILCGWLGHLRRHHSGTSGYINPRAALTAARLKAAILTHTYVACQVQSSAGHFLSRFLVFNLLPLASILLVFKVGVAQNDPISLNSV